MTVWLTADRQNVARRPLRATSYAGLWPGQMRQALKRADSMATAITQIPWKNAPIPAGIHTASHQARFSLTHHRSNRSGAREYGKAAKYNTNTAPGQEPAPISDVVCHLRLKSTTAGIL